MDVVDEADAADLFDDLGWYEEALDALARMGDYKLPDHPLVLTFERGQVTAQVGGRSRVIVEPYTEQERR